MSKDIAALALVSLVIIVSGCSHPPELKTSTATIELSDSQSKSFEAWVVNNLDDSAEYNLTVDSPDVITVKGDIDNVEKEVYHLGEASSRSTTNKKTLTITGDASQFIPQQISSTYVIQLTAAGTTGETVETVQKNITVTLSK